jgi:diacylglycerol kinase family enzyme
MRFVGVFNRDGGTFRTMDMDQFSADATRILGERGHTIDIQLVAGKELIPALDAAVARKNVDVLLAAGGDGTISAAAEAAFRSGVPLAVLPAGTMNLFARSLHLPLDLPGALAAIASGEMRDVDIATANGKPFVHQYAVGIHTRLVKIREEMTYKSRLGKMAASVHAILLAIRRPPRFQAEVRSKRGLESRQCSQIVVSNNPFGEGHIPHADALDSGLLGVYITEPMAPRDLAKLSIDVLLGSWKASPLVLEREISQVTLTFPRKKSSAMATIDGELVPLETRVDLKIHPGALKVLAPAAEVSAAA